MNHLNDSFIDTLEDIITDVLSKAEQGNNQIESIDPKFKNLIWEFHSLFTKDCNETDSDNINNFIKNSLHVFLQKIDYQSIYQCCTSSQLNLQNTEIIFCIYVLMLEYKLISFYILDLMMNDQIKSFYKKESAILDINFLQKLHKQFMVFEQKEITIISKWIIFYQNNYILIQKNFGEFEGFSLQNFSKCFSQEIPECIKELCSEETNKEMKNLLHMDINLEKRNFKKHSGTTDQKIQISQEQNSIENEIEKLMKEQQDFFNQNQDYQNKEITWQYFDQNKDQTHSQILEKFYLQFESVISKQQIEQIIEQSKPQCCQICDTNFDQNQSQVFYCILNQIYFCQNCSSNTSVYDPISLYQGKLQLTKVSNITLQKLIDLTQIYIQMINLDFIDKYPHQIKEFLSLRKQLQLMFKQICDPFIMLKYIKDYKNFLFQNLYLTINQVYEIKHDKLNETLTKLIGFFKDHFNLCNKCQSNSVTCQQCFDQQPIFIWDIKDIETCSICKKNIHKKCQENHWIACTIINEAKKYQIE